MAIGPDNVGIQTVDCPASIDGYLAGGNTGGAATLAVFTQQAATQCPKSPIILSGHNQGAQVVHLGVAQLPAAVASSVIGVVSSSCHPWLRRTKH